MVGGNPMNLEPQGTAKEIMHWENQDNKGLFVFSAVGGCLLVFLNH